MRSDGPPTPSDDVTAADWVRERLSPPGDNVVTTTVPGGFAAYARILHPVQIPGFGAALVRGIEVERHRDEFADPMARDRPPIGQTHSGAALEQSGTG